MVAVDQGQNSFPQLGAVLKSAAVTFPVDTKGESL